MSHTTAMTKAELARELGVSRAYITMIAGGKRQPSKTIANKLKELGVNIQIQSANHKSCSSAIPTLPQAAQSILPLSCKVANRESQRAIGR